MPGSRVLRRGVQHVCSDGLSAACQKSHRLATDCDGRDGPASERRKQRNGHSTKGDQAQPETAKRKHAYCHPAKGESTGCHAAESNDALRPAPNGNDPLRDARPAGLGVNAGGHMQQGQPEERCLGSVIHSLRGAASANGGLIFVRRRSNNRFHHRLDFADLLVAEVRVLFQGAQHHLVKTRVNLNFPRGRLQTLAGQLAGEHFVENDAERINVGAAVHPLRIGLLLRRAVTGGAQSGLRGIFRRDRFAGVGAAVRLAQHFGDAKIGDLHPAVFVEKKILRFDVAVDNAPVVGELQRVTQRRHDGQSFLRREFSRAQKLAKIRAVHKFHEQKIKSARLSEVVNGDNVGMVQGRQRLRLAREAFGEFPVAHALRRQEFERDEAVQRPLPRLVNHPHAAAPETFENLKLRKVGRQFLRRERFPRLGRLRVRLRRRHGLGHQTARTQAGRRRRRQGRAALRAGIEFCT